MSRTNSSGNLSSGSSGRRSPSTRGRGGADMDERQISDAKKESLMKELSTVDSVLRDIADEHMTPAQAILYAMRNSVDVQRTPLMQQLNVHHSEYGQEEKLLFTALTVCIVDHSAEVQNACATGLLDALMSCKSSTIMSLFFQVERIIFKVLPEALKNWKKLYFEILQYMPHAIILGRTIPFVRELSQPSRTVPERCFAADVISQIAEKQPALTMDLIETIRTLAVDPEASVRRALAEGLDPVFQALPAFYVRETMVTSPISILLLDESVEVSGQMFARLVKLCSYADEEFVADFLFPVMLQYAVNAPPEVQGTVFSSFGQLVWYSRRCFGPHDNDFIVSTYIKMCATPTESSRDRCAFNYPALYATFGKERKYRRQLLNVLCSFCTDSSLLVRRSIAAGFHELFALTPCGEREAMLQLESNAMKLMADDDSLVREKLFNCVGTILKAFKELHEDEPATQIQVLNAVVPLIVKYEQAITTNWRKVAALIQHFESFPQYFSFEMLEKEFVPVLVSHMVRGASALARRVATIMATYLHTVETEEHCRRVARNVVGLVQALAKSSSSCYRAAFSTMVGGFLDVFSTRFLQIYLLPDLIRLKSDPVVAVRMRITTILPRLLFSAPLYQEVKESLIEPLLSDPDNIVVARTKEVIDRSEAYSIANPFNTFDGPRDLRLEKAEAKLFLPEIIAAGNEAPNSPLPQPPSAAVSRDGSTKRKKSIL